MQAKWGVATGSSPAGGREELEEMSRELASMREEMEEARDVIDNKDWELSELRKGVDMEVAWTWNEARKVHKCDLDAWDDLITLLKEKISSLERLGNTGSADTGERVGSSFGSRSTSKKQRQEERGVHRLQMMCRWGLGGYPCLLSHHSRGKELGMKVLSITGYASWNDMLILLSGVLQRSWPRYV